MTNPVGGFSNQIRVALTVDDGVAYTSGDVVGGAFEIPKAVRHEGAEAVLHALMVIDADEEDAVFELLLFDSEPGQTYTDNSAAPTLDGDLLKLIGKVSIAAADYVSTGGAALASITAIGLPLIAAQGGTSLWGVLVTTSTPTYTADDDLSLLFSFLQS